MARREAATLVEVLVAIFVMGIGLMALLVLFPLGALRMERAIQDQRCSECARNAHGICNARDVRNDIDLFNPVDMFITPPPAPPVYPGVDPGGPSYPVYVDPIGYRLVPAPYQNWLCGIPGSVQRSTVSYVRNHPNPGLAAMRWFSLLDDTIFAINGLPNTVAPGTYDRNNLYSWGYLLQRPLAGDLDVTDVSIVVYKQRPLAPGITLPEYAYVAYFDTARSVVTLDYSAPGSTPPPVRPGEWVLDATPVLTTVGGVNYRTSHANFYRVASVAELAGNQMELEVQGPLRDFIGSSIPQSAPGVYQGTGIVLEGVVEVFGKGAGWKQRPSPPLP
jgi:hypothetical protein